MSKLIESHWMTHPGGSESRMWCFCGASLWEQTPLVAISRGAVWWMRRPPRGAEKE